MIKALSTKVLKPVPREFIEDFVKYGQEGCEQMYGKRATARYKRAVGPLRLKRLRRGELAREGDA